MADKPIIFSAPMVRALLDGRKSQTRRRLKPQPVSVNDDGLWYRQIGGGVVRNYPPIPYAPGDRLWVKEAWRPHYLGDGIWDLDVSYAADGERRTIKDGEFGDNDWNWPKSADRGNVSPLFMPRWASRLTLTVSDVRVQQLQEISEADAIAEGVTRCAWAEAMAGDGRIEWHVPERNPGEYPGLTNAYPSPISAFYELWDSLHGPDAWAANPWVPALTFDVHRGNIDQIATGQAVPA